jgi:molybdopterin converting factor small subunit
VVDAVCGSYDARFAQIAAVSSFVVNGERAGLDTVLADGDEVAILPPVSGGGIGPLTTADLRVRRRDARLGY